MKAKSLKIIGFIDMISVVLFMISLFLPYWYTGDPMDGGSYMYGFEWYAYTFGFGFLGILFILTSVIHLFKFTISRVLLYRGIGLFFFGGVEIGGFIAAGTQRSLGAYLNLIILAELVLTFIILIATRASLKRSIKEDIRDYIFKLSSTYDSISLSRVVENFRISPAYIPKLQKYLEQLIFDRVIYAKISGKTIQFDREELERIAPGISEKPTEIEVDYKKRLYGMIRLRKEIDLEEASEFLNIPTKQIESLLYDLAGDETIQGNFEGNKFIITSDVDNFIDVLESSFSSWEHDRRKLT